MKYLIILFSISSEILVVFSLSTLTICWLPEIILVLTVVHLFLSINILLVEIDISDIKDLSIEDGQKAAKLCAINIIAQVKKAVNGDLNKIKNCVKITGFVNSTEDFVDQPKIINAASELLTAVFGDNGKHARAAVSSNSLPLGIAVEIDAIFEVK